MDGLWNESWPYWRYIRTIAEDIYGENGFAYIAYTNIIKCNNSATKDNTSKLVKDNCINKMQVLKKEIEVLKPKKVIFLTSWYYDNYFNSIFNNIKNINNKKVKIGTYSMPWSEFYGEINDNKIKVLRIGHPEHKTKLDYVNALVEWIKQN